MIKFKEKTNLIQITLAGNYDVCTNEQFMYINPAYIINLYQDHSWIMTKQYGLESKLVHKYYVEVLNNKYEIIPECYYKLEKLLSK